MIVEAVKARDNNKASVLRIIKSKYQEWQTAKANVGKALTEEVKISILKKLKEEYTEDAKMYENKLSGQDIARQYFESAKLIESMLPKEATIEEIMEVAKKYVEPGDKKGMGAYIKTVKAQLPGADGKLVADVVKQLIG